MRIRFTSPHPKDFPLEVLETIQKHPNICKQIHLPAQSGSDRLLDIMNRKYTKADYIALTHRIRETVPGVSISSDFICGFCSETEADFEESLDLIRTVRYDFGFLYAYSMREKTLAHRKMQDDVSETEKARRLAKMIGVFREAQLERMKESLGSKQIVLVEKLGKFENQLKGLTGKGLG